MHRHHGAFCLLSGRCVLSDQEATLDVTATIVMNTAALEKKIFAKLVEFLHVFSPELPPVLLPLALGCRTKGLDGKLIFPGGIRRHDAARAGSDIAVKRSRERSFTLRERCNESATLMNSIA